MQLGKKRIKMSLGRRRAIVGALGLVLALMLVVAACGEAATATPEPAMEEPTSPAGDDGGGHGYGSTCYA